VSAQLENRSVAPEVPQPEVTQAEVPGAEPTNPYTVVAALCHDIRTPLGSLQAAVEVLHDYPAMSPQDLASMVERLRRGLVWLEGLVEDLSTWAAHRDGALEISRVPVHVADDVVTRAVDVVGPLLMQRRQEVRTHKVEKGVWAMGDPVRLTQVVVNLLANASAYGPPGSPIDVAASGAGADDDSIEVRVTDRGPGLRAEEQATVFDRYVRGAAGLAGPHHRGSGLGLSIVREIVHLHGGSVGVESVPGKGASFWFRVPSPSGSPQGDGLQEAWQRRPTT
jgi:signal transduction histidine kinase